MDPREDFDAFYREHALAVVRYFARRTRDPELAADLTAETFAAALAGRHRFDPSAGRPGQWLFGIARHQLQRALERHAADDRLRRRLGIRTPSLDDEATEAIERLAGEAEGALAELAPAYRDAVRARVVDEAPYGEIARAQDSSEAAVRQRVSRGLAALRARLGRGEATP
jgi:RNA polymerase sigma-70 factor (ECF subfamily)